MPVSTNERSALMYIYSALHDVSQHTYVDYEGDVSCVCSEGCEQLEYLDVGWCKITDSGLQAVGSRLKRLITFQCAGCRDITDAGVRYISAGCPLLQTFSLARVSVRYTCFCSAAEVEPDDIRTYDSSVISPPLWDICKL
jgi:hypothetical protein